MPQPTLTLESNSIDPRSRQQSFSLTVSTRSDETYRIFSITPRLREGAGVIETVETSGTNLQTRRLQILDELNELATDCQITGHEEYRQKYAESMKEVYQEALTLDGYFRLTGHVLRRMVSRKTLNNMFDYRLKRSVFRIYDLKDAEHAQADFVGTDNAAISKMFGAKILQLKRLHKTLGEINQSGTGDVIAGSGQTSTFTISFKRGWLNRKRYSLGFDVEFLPITPDAAAKAKSAQTAGKKTPPAGQEEDDLRAKSRVVSVSKTCDISPNPLLLTLVAVFSAILGAGIQLLVAENIRFQEVAAKLNSAQLLVAPAIALIFFNIYERIQIGKDLNLPVDWRSALFVGALCGLAHDRIIAAFRALIGSG